MAKGFRLPDVTVNWQGIVFAFGVPPFETSQIEDVINKTFICKVNHKPTSEELERVRLLFGRSLMNRIEISRKMTGRLHAAS